MGELGLNTTPPEEVIQQTATDKPGDTPTPETSGTVDAPVDRGEGAEPLASDTSGTTDAPIDNEAGGEPAKPDEFIENLNKRFNTQYKSEDEFKALFEAPKKISEYETRLKDYEDIKKSAEERQKKIEELESLNDPLKYFSSPETYIAEQLRIKYPDKDPVLLQEIAVTDVNSMEDFDLLIKSERLFNRNLPEGGRFVKDVLYKRYGIDAETDIKELDGATKTQIAMDANVIRGRINDLKKGIELPRVVTKEDREKFQADSLAKKMQDVAPVRDQFTKFDKFSIEGLGDWQIPDDYKAKAGEMFDGMFIDANMEMNEDNLASAIALRDAYYLKENFSKIKEAIIKQAQTDLQAKIDAESHNDVPPNTATATDQGGADAPQGIGALIESLNRR